MRSKLFRLIMLLAMAAVMIGGVRQIYRNMSQSIALKPLPLDPDNPARKKVGALTFLGAWELGSDNQNFGGISALTALPDGRFLAVSDAGTMIGFGLSNDLKADRPFIAALPAPGTSYRDRDSESLAFDPASGRFWIGYEVIHAIKRMPPSLSRIDGEVRPESLRDSYSNRSIEALARLPDGRFFLFSEGGDDKDKDYPAIAFSGDPVEPGTASFGFRYRPPAGYRPTDATALPDGRLLLLNRRIAFPTGFSAKLTIVDPAKIERDAVIRGTVIAALKPPLLVDNMEGITITREGDRTIVWLISDNNFNIFQRTLLMKFALNLKKQKPDADHSTPGFDSL